MAESSRSCHGSSLPCWRRSQSPSPCGHCRACVDRSNRNRNTLDALGDNAPRWQRMRAHQLAIEPLCRMCKLSGKITPANVSTISRNTLAIRKNSGLASCSRSVDHVTKDEKNTSRQEAMRAMSTPSGFPLHRSASPGEPSRAAFRHFGFGIPHHIRPSAIPVTLVLWSTSCGQVDMGRGHKRSGDTVISLDDCKVRCGGRPWVRIDGFSAAQCLCATRCCGRSRP